MAKIVRLASSSSRRRQLLLERYTGITLDFGGLVGDELPPPNRCSVHDQVDFILNQKIERARLEHHLISSKEEATESSASANLWIVADTLVEDPHDSFLSLGQPSDTIAALHMLTNLSGRRHLVWSGTAVLDFSAADIVVHRSIESATVEFNQLSEDEIAELIESNSWKGKAGAYDLAGPAGAHAHLISGHEVTVLGFSHESTKFLDVILSDDSTSS